MGTTQGREGQRYLLCLHRVLNKKLNVMTITSVCMNVWTYPNTHEELVYVRSSGVGVNVGHQLSKKLCA